MSQDSQSEGINIAESNIYKLKLLCDSVYLLLINYALIDPVDCNSDPCQLAWLIRDYPDLSLLVEDGECSNGTQFSQLDKKTFDDFLCPSPSLIDVR